MTKNQFSSHSEALKSEAELAKIVMPFASKRMEEVRQTGRRFVHYSSAEAAVGMLTNAEVWMRKASCMNDFMEIEHGLQCLFYAYNAEAGEPIRKCLEAVFPGICEELHEPFNNWIPSFKGDTYLTCLSEHDDDEDEIGRLSMWRAYGGSTGTALVLNNAPFLSPSNVLKAYSSPVAYLSPDEFRDELFIVASQIADNASYFQLLGREQFRDLLFHIFRFSVLCTKHPGFREEREWRIVHSPSIERSEKLKPDVKVIRGIPQSIMKIPLEDFPDEGFTGAAIPSLVNRIIIGPSMYPSAMREAFVILLQNAGVEDAEDKVWISRIPLRQ